MENNLFRYFSFWATRFCNLFISSQYKIPLHIKHIRVMWNWIFIVVVFAPCLPEKKKEIIHFLLCLLSLIIIPELPHSPPTLWTEFTKYDPGDILRANCSTQPSKPSSTITFQLNQNVVSKTFILWESYLMWKGVEGLHKLLIKMLAFFFSLSNECTLKGYKCSAKLNIFIILATYIQI